jgi:S-formylglutathione hydrolase FrmB
LAVDRAVLVYLPTGYDQHRNDRYPVLYLLHGASQTGHLLWTGSLANVQDIADRVFGVWPGRGLIVVMPDASSPYLGTLYSNSLTEGNWENFVADDLVNYVDHHYRTVVDRRSRGIAGHSRGGYGALRIAINRPDVFSAVYALSPCCTEPEGDPRQLQSALEIHTPEAVDESRRQQPFGGPMSVLAQGAAWSPNAKRPPLYFDLPDGADPSTRAVAEKWRANSMLGLVNKNISNLKKLRAIAFDVGDQDRGVSIPGIIELDTILTQAMIDHTFEQYAGTHVDHVSQRLEAKVFPFFLKNLSGNAQHGSQIR